MIGTYAEQNLYRKIVQIGALPNAGKKFIAHGISNILGIRAMYGVAVYNGGVVQLPFLTPSSTQTCIEIQIVGSNIKIHTQGANRIGLTGYVIIEYVKL